MNHPDPSRLNQILNRFADRRVVVIGDLILDEFVWGRVRRISPEAPVPVVEITRESVLLGGAANVAVNLAVMGARPLLVGVVGRDADAARLAEQLAVRGIDGGTVLEDPSRRTSVKTRIIAHQQQVCRTDRESRGPVGGELSERLAGAFLERLQEADAVILSDYGKGVLADGLIQKCVEAARGRGCFVAVDPQPDHFALYSRASIVTPNKMEAEQASGRPVVDGQSLDGAAAALIDKAQLSHLLITRGEEGMTLYGEGEPVQIPTMAREVFDVTGAGDTVIATLTLAVAAGATVYESALLANSAAGVVVGKLGTASATREEIVENLVPGP